MRSYSSKFFQTGVRYQKVLEDGTETKVTEQYVVDALSFTECEARIIEYMSGYGHTDVEVMTIKRVGFAELFLSDIDDEDKYYECVMNFITIDEKTNKEKRTKTRYLVQGKTIENARKNVDDVMGKTMIDYDIVSLKETPILDFVKNDKS